MLQLMPIITTDDTRYLAALSLVTQIDQSLRSGRRHYRTRDGQLLHHLDQVVNAILTDNLEPAAKEIL